MPLDKDKDKSPTPSHLHIQALQKRTVSLVQAGGVPEDKHVIAKRWGVMSSSVRTFSSS
jgi:hypothetical protein